MSMTAANDHNMPVTLSLQTVFCEFFNGENFIGF
jgi:hypothetical protein